MSKLPFAPIFSAAHIAKWDALRTHDRATLSRFGLVDTPTCPPITVNDGDTSNDDHIETYGGNVFSTYEHKNSVQVTSVEVLTACSFTRPGGARAIESCENMAVKTYTWITLWFVVTAPVILWDATYCFMRPRSMVGGDLHWIWKPYGLYQEIDYVYGVKALKENNGFTNAQSLLNVVETTLNMGYLYLAYVSSWPGAPLVGFSAVLMTLSKTVLYWLQEYYCGGCAIGHNAWATLLLLWVIPNGLWLVFPSMIAWRLGGDILSYLALASRSARKAASGKAQ